MLERADVLASASVAKRSTADDCVSQTMTRGEAVQSFQSRQLS